jgi:hypothetical protein
MLKFNQKEAAFCKKRRKNSFESGSWALVFSKPMAQIQKSLFASFSSEKEVLACS